MYYTIHKNYIYIDSMLNKKKKKKLILQKNYHIKIYYFLKEYT